MGLVRRLHVFFPRHRSIRDSLCVYRGTRRHNYLEKEMNIELLKTKLEAAIAAANKKKISGDSGDLALLREGNVYRTKSAAIKALSDMLE